MTKYILTNDFEKCCGCGACEQVCPQKAIELKPNEEGFLYPVLNKSLCVECGLCKKICAYDNEMNLREPIDVYAVQNKSKEALLKSSSGGMFSAMADYVISVGGAVSGCIFDDHFKAIHVLSGDKTVIEKMQGSKYVQSEIGTVYKDIKKYLESDKPVLFSGTPCQVDGLRRFLQKDYDKLFTVDLICHGVPSPLLLQEYLNQESKKGTIIDLKFRNKERNGWCSQGSITYSADKKEKTRTITPFRDSYYNLYYLGNCVSRLSCYSCPYATEKRVADITIGDYWNIDEKLNYSEFKNGMSVVLANTQKGKELFDNIKSNLKVFKTDCSHAKKGNGNLVGTCNKPLKRNHIYRKILENGYEQTVREECNYSYVVPFIKNHVPRGLKQIIKKVLR